MKRLIISLSAIAAVIVSPAIESAFAAGVTLRTVQCEVTNQANPDTLWLGWPSLPHENLPPKSARSPLWG